jgi:allantoinase
MAREEFILSSRRVATPEGLRPAALRIANGRIESVESPGAFPAGIRVEDVGDAVVFPGLVDTHVHANDPGRSEWEGFPTATAAAAAGGVTTLLDMPLNSLPPTTTHAALHAKLDAAAGRCAVDVGFWGGVVPGNESELEGLAAAGAFGFKCFLSPSGVPEFPELSEADLGRVMRRMAELHSVLLVHAEDPREIRGLDGATRSYSDYLASRPRAAENAAIAGIVRLCRETGARVHVLHLSSADALEPLAAARREGLPVTVETCPHYLVFSAEEIPDGATAFKCAPPIRERENRERLWLGLADGIIDMVVSDHSPCVPPMKCLDSGDFSRAWGGIASLELTLSAVWTAAADRGIPVERLAEWMSAAPARLAGLDGNRGAIAAGRAADLVVWDPEAQRTIDSTTLLQRHKETPYSRRELAGVVRTTYLRGEKIYDGGRLVQESAGEVLLAG